MALLLPLPLVVMLLAQAPGRARPPPPRGLDAVHAAFVQGDLPRASEAARVCARREPKVCRPVLKSLGQYVPLAKAVDRLSAVQARQLLELDRQISPDARCPITLKAIEKFVSSPLDLARHHAQQGNAASARVIAQQVLDVDPANQEAQALVAPGP
jgi:hypothetical protein